MKNATLVRLLLLIATGFVITGVSCRQWWPPPWPNWHSSSSSSSSSSTRGWVSKTSPTTETLHDIFLLEEGDSWLSGWAVGENGTMVGTSDGGENWVAITTGLTTETLYGVYFSDTLTGHIWGTNNTYLTTIDGGGNWEGVGTDIISTEGTDIISDIAFDDTGVPIYAVGGAEEKDQIWEYDGSTWDTISTSEPSTNTLLNKISVNVEGTDWYVVGEDIDSNPGAGTPSWRKGNNTSWDSIGGSNSVSGDNYSVGLTVLQNVWVAGENGIMFSPDLGTNWQPSYDQSEIRDIHMIDMSGTPIGWAVGREGVILKYDTQWNEQDTHSTDLYGVYFINDSDGAAVGASGSILITNDGGD